MKWQHRDTRRTTARPQAPHEGVALATFQLFAPPLGLTAMLAALRSAEGAMICPLGAGLLGAAGLRGEAEAAGRYECEGMKVGFGVVGKGGGDRTAEARYVVGAGGGLGAGKEGETGEGDAEGAWGWL